jgi:hypothetical protein
MEIYQKNAHGFLRDCRNTLITVVPVGLNMRILNISGIYAPIYNPNEFVFGCYCTVFLIRVVGFVSNLLAHLLNQGIRFKSQMCLSTL